jgi:hypothetical protein
MMLTVMLLASIGLRGHTTCPTVQEVSDRLAGLDTDRVGDLRWVELKSENDRLQLSLWGTDGNLEAVRELPAPASCDALARAAAVTIATWSATPPPARVQAPEPPRPVHTIFDPETLAAERLKLAMHQTEIDRDAREFAHPTPRRLRWSLITLSVALAAQIAGGVLLVRNHDLANGTNIEMLGSAVALPGVVWLLVSIFMRDPNQALAF